MNAMRPMTRLTLVLIAMLLVVSERDHVVAAPRADLREPPLASGVARGGRAAPRRRGCGRRPSRHRAPLALLPRRRHHPGRRDRRDPSLHVRLPRPASARLLVRDRRREGLPRLDGARRGTGARARPEPRADELAEPAVGPERAGRGAGASPRGATDFGAAGGSG